MKLASITEAQLILFKKKVTPAEGERERKFENLAAKRKKLYAKKIIKGL